MQLAGVGALFVGCDHQPDAPGRGYQDTLCMWEPSGMAHCLAGRPVVSVNMSELPDIDQQFPYHPLTMARELLQSIAGS